MTNNISSQAGLASIRAGLSQKPVYNPYRREFTPGQIVTYVQALGTPYEKPARSVEYVEPYAYGFDEHVVFLEDGDKVAILDRDIVA